MKQTVNQRVEQLRTHLKMTQQRFAELVDISLGQLSRIENGKNVPQPGTLDAIIAATGVDREWLLHGRGELKTQDIASHSKPFSWKEEAFEALREEKQVLQDQVDMLKVELNRVWAMAKHFAGDRLPNFHKVVEEAAPAVHPNIIKGYRGASTARVIN